MNRRILIVADAYGKPAYAPRLRTLCEHLHRSGWNVEVYTERFVPLDFPHDYPIHELDLYRNRTWDWALKTAWSLLTDWKNRRFATLLQREINGKQYDLVFCTTFSTFPLRAAYSVAHSRGIPLHVDLRDIEEQIAGAQYQEHRAWYWRPFRRWYSAVNIRRRNRILRRAQQVSTVSPWHQQFLQRINPATCLIYNGFDADIFFPENIVAPAFNILYTGRLYEPVLQDPTLLFQGLQRLSRLPHLRVQCFTDAEGQRRLRTLAEQYGIPHLMEYHNYVAPAKVPHLLRQCSVALVFSNRTTKHGPFGMLGTKFYEALGTERPVLCVRSDESTLEQTIRYTNAGIAARTPEEVEQFIREKYTEWQTNGFTRQPVRNKLQFARQHQTQQFEQLFSKLINTSADHD